MNLSRSGYLLAAAALHGAALWGFHFGPPAFIADENDPGDSMEVGLVESAEASQATAETTPEEPLAPEPPPTPPEPEPTPEIPPPPADAIAEPESMPEPPKATPPPAQKPKPKAASRTLAAPKGGPSNARAVTATAGTGTGTAGAGDAAHATWRNRVKPAYPSAARTAGQAGNVLLMVNINALGQCTGANVYKSSGYPSLDQAALAAARASSFHPRRVAGVPLADTISIPYRFRLGE